ncbi:MBOAT family O-acyltransferase [Butyrivibrio sp. LC3010]|uniref:MBOAT family O-acyltransferase n=1 Tax=Butyrivibrio sp. LC3010 TaxID=1280680 RepID=UPI0004083B24|nr:MBOAT family O-acyltransferase [Butyrivibrio sp. LC3010]
MVFQLTTFCFLFITFILFHISPGAIRKFELLAFSVFFIIWQGKSIGIITICAITAFTYLCGLMISFLKKREMTRISNVVSAIGIIALAMVLFGWKYLAAAANLPGLYIPDNLLKAAMPIGLSFYIFQAISYLADVTTKKIDAKKNLINFALYMMWFPKWMSGPIERAEDFIIKIENSKNTKLFDFDRAVRVLSYILWGLFMKMVIADRIGIPVDITFDNPLEFGPVTLLLCTFLYTIQIYCDFAGYTNLMIGISMMFGIELIQNFRTPYFAENIVQFWRRWHLSLSNFLKDYIYIPLGGNRKGSFRKAFNILVVFLVCGMWHGAGFTFIIWGVFHGIMNVVTNILDRGKLRFLVRGITGWAISFLTVSFAWIFFRANSLSNAFDYIKAMFIRDGKGLSAGFTAEEGLILGLSSIEWFVAAVSIMLLSVFDFWAYRSNKIPPELMSKRWGDFSRGIGFALFALIILIFGRYGAGEEIRSFVYAQF